MVNNNQKEITKQTRQKEAIKSILDSVAFCIYCPIKKSCDFIENEIGYTLCETFNMNDDLKIKD